MTPPIHNSSSTIHNSSSPIHHSSFTIHNSLVPRLRFPEFRDAGEWETISVGDIFYVTRGYVLSMTLVNDVKTDSTPYPVYSSQTKHNGLCGYYGEYLYEDAITWTTDGANAGDVNFREGKFYCTNVCGVLLNKYGYANQCISEIINSVAKKHVSYVGNPKLMNGVMSKIVVPIPSLQEQQKIADCLSSLDALIAAQSEKLDALKTHKKGLMPRLFPRPGETTPRLRFPEFRDAGAWESETIASLGDVITGSTPGTARRDYYGGGIPFVSPADISEFRFVADSKTTLTTLGFEETRPIRANSVMFVCIGSTIGKVAQNRRECATNQQINSVVPNSEHDGAFVYYVLDHHSDHIANLAGKQAVPIINKTLFSTVALLVPELPEQQRIADCLSSLDGLIAAQSEKLDALKIHKKGLMQQLFPAVEEK